MAESSGLVRTALRRALPELPHVLLEEVLAYARPTLQDQLSWLLSQQQLHRLELDSQHSVDVACWKRDLVWLAERKRCHVTWRRTWRSFPLDVLCASIEERTLRPVEDATHEFCPALARAVDRAWSRCQRPRT